MIDLAKNVRERKKYSSVVRNIYLLQDDWIFYEFGFANFTDFVLNKVQSGFSLYHIPLIHWWYFKNYSRELRCR